MATKVEIVDFISKEIAGKDESFLEKAAERVVARFKIAYDIAVDLVWEVYADLHKE